jgi:hypothetical protein
MSVLTENAPAYLTPQDIAVRYSFDQDTVYTWITSGVRVRGQMIRLDALRIGKSWRIEQAAWERFLAACNPGREDVRPEHETTAAARASTKRMRKRLGMDP